MTAGELKKSLEGIDDGLEVIVARSHSEERGSSITWAPAIRIYQRYDVGHSQGWLSCNAYNYTKGCKPEHIIGEPEDVFTLYII